VSSVLQRKANRDEPAGREFGVSLLVSVVQRPAWLFGFVAMLASFLLQATALDAGTLASVEPVLVVELPLTLVIGAAVFRQPLHRRVWVSGAAMAGGLALFIIALNPHGGDADHVPTGLALTATGATALGIVAMVFAGRATKSARVRTALYGAAAGSGFGLTASLIKVAVTHLSAGGAASLFTTWETYGLAVTGVASVVLVQAALHSGTLVDAQPGITLFDPLVSVLWGTVVLDESTQTGPSLLLAALGFAIIVAAVFSLAKPVALQADATG
jgi:drug/metabolite transporter (DMT)-like permease